MAQPYYTESTVPCDDPICTVLQQKWLELISRYNAALGFGQEVSGANYLGSIPLNNAALILTYLNNANSELKGALDIIELLPEMSTHLLELYAEIQQKLPEMKSNLSEWNQRLDYSIIRAIHPEQGQNLPEYLPTLSNFEKTATSLAQ
jgi:hypothetical protein